MTLNTIDRAKVTSTTTGTGSFTLGSAVTGYQDFTGVGNGNQTYYTIENGTEWETGIASYVEGWSNFFDGTGDYLTIADDPAFEVSGDFTVEAWFYMTNTPATFGCIVTKGASGIYQPYYFFINSSRTLLFYSSSNGTSWNVASAVSLGTILPEKWYHVAVSRSGTDMRLFLDGALITTITNGDPLFDNTRAVAVGGRSDGTEIFTGYITDVRIVNGTAVYTSAFTPPTEPLTAISNTVLLTSQSNTFKDNSINNFTVTKLGDTVVKNFIPYSGVSNPTLFRDVVLDSSNSGNLVDFSSGTKNVFIPHPAVDTQGENLILGNNSIDSGLVAWKKFQKKIYRSVNAGSTFNNNGVGGIISTYSTVIPAAAGNYGGGVLATNGDIHFVPTTQVRGQKVSAAGVVSTYSLVYTTSSATSTFTGGVLDTNGDIHFIPFNGNRGQRVSAIGAVSTYSLVYTATSIYGRHFGGVLAPNGDIHFVPCGADRGQKVSAAGVVSTYTLVHTKAGAYQGGVLAPNGDVHFVPHTADVGQKISAAGVVSTYSLVYTLSGGAYRGGVVAPNGDIHFIPEQANRGQKISINGVVSTYTLVYTGSSLWNGAVLSPTGDIHFIPGAAAARGQKISPNGVVSTYPLILTSASGLWSGGVLGADGDIHFIPTSGSVVKKISTCPAIPFEIETCLSPFFNKL